MNKIFKKYLLISVFSLIVCLGTTSVAYANQSPIANAGADLYLTSGQVVTLQGSATDSDGGTLNYSWNCTGGTLSNSSIAQPTYTASNSYATFTCTLTVTDNGGLSNSDVANVYINYNGISNTKFISPITETATNIQSNQATLNGSFTSTNDSSNSAWFQYGLNTSYGTETSHQLLTGTSGSFTQTASSLLLNSTYHYRLVVQDLSGNLFYGQDITFLTNPYYNTGELLISKKAINLTSQNLTWSNSMNASPSDILSFSITIYPNRDLHNVIVRDILPSGLLYNDNLLINATRNFSDNPANGISLGTIKSGEIVIVSYQVRVCPASNFVFGTTNINSQATISSDEYTQTSNATITINNSQVSGVGTINPTNLSTGLTNRFFTESFFLPILLIIAGSWLYFSGRVYQFADWLSTKL